MIDNSTAALLKKRNERDLQRRQRLLGLIRRYYLPIRDTDWISTSELEQMVQTELIAKLVESNE